MRNHLKTLIASTALVMTPAVLLAQDLTPAGTELALGETAVVQHIIPDGPIVNIEFTVNSITQGSREQIANFNVPPELADALPTFVTYSYTNISDEDISGQSIGAIVAIDDRGQEQNSILVRGGQGTFGDVECATNASPQGMTPGETHEGCLLFMVHENGHIDAVAFKGSYRHETGRDMRAEFPVYYDPIRWLAADETAEDEATEDEAEKGTLQPN